MYEIIWIFFIYSFLGWMLECFYAALKNKTFVNRGVLGGPVCSIYGISAVLYMVLLPELSGHVVFLFIGSGILFGACEWLSGKALEHIYHKKWYDYSNHRYHIDGYVSIFSVAAGGFLGVICTEWLTPLFLALIGAVPLRVGKLAMAGALVVLFIDAAWTHSYHLGIPQRFPETEVVQNRILKISAKLNEWVIGRSKRRLEKAYPGAKQKTAGEKSRIFAEGCSFYKVFWLFVIGAFLGDIVETVFCYLTAGIWMSRSSLVWGDFSIVWGLGIAGATWVLYNYRDKPDRFLFGFGTFLGGAFEYVCSVFTEKVFGQVFWDYSGIPFNLGGRINLLYCFFWGIAAVVWLKMLYPYISGWIEKIPLRAGKYLTGGAVIFMAANILVSSAALMRYESRNRQIPAANGMEEWLDVNYGNEKMEKIYPNSVLIE